MDERRLREKLDKIFGNSPLAQDLKELVFRANTCMNAMDLAEEYQRIHDATIERLNKEVLPIHSESVDTNTIIPQNVSENVDIIYTITADETNTNRSGDNTEGQTGGDQNTIFIDARDKLYAT